MSTNVTSLPAIIPADSTTAMVSSDSQVSDAKRQENEEKADLKARVTVRSTLLVAVAATDIECWLTGAGKSAPERERRAADRALQAYRRKLGEK
jgi:hypothetical protein